jgi:hypothetical protein
MSDRDSYDGGFEPPIEERDAPFCECCGRELDPAEVRWLELNNGTGVWTDPDVTTVSAEKPRCMEIAKTKRERQMTVALVLIAEVAAHWVPRCKDLVVTEALRSIIEYAKRGLKNDETQDTEPKPEGEPD